MTNAEILKGVRIALEANHQALSKLGSEIRKHRILPLCSRHHITFRDGYFYTKTGECFDDDVNPKFLESINKVLWTRVDDDGIELYEYVGPVSQSDVTQYVELCEEHVTDAVEQPRPSAYGRCPYCGREDPPFTQRQKSPNGNTICGACKQSSPNSQW